MRGLLAALCWIFLGTVAHADIAWQLDRFGAGSMLVMKDRSGAIAHVKRGTEGTMHVFDVYKGQGPTAAFVGRYKTTPRGDVVETVAADGAVTRFVPHRCNRTLGTCSYTMVHPDGFTEPRQRVTEATRSGLRYRDYGLDGLMAEGTQDLDDTGTPKGGVQDKRPSGEGKTRTRRILLAMK